MSTAKKAIVASLCIMSIGACGDGNSENNSSPQNNTTSANNATTATNNTTANNATTGNNASAGNNATTGNNQTTGNNTTASGLHPAFAEFDEENTDVYLEDGMIVVETNGLPNHASVYWGEGHELYEEPTDEMVANLTPATIPGYDGSATLRLPLEPALAAEETETTLGAIGIAVTGAAIFNDQEGNGPLTDGVAAGLDTSGGHIGPAEYHYHLEPKKFSDDDSNLVGVLADGFFIYGRKCASTGTYPTDLDDSGGHTSTTQHVDAPEYHYHIINEVYLNQYYIIFAGTFKGEVGAFDGGGAGGPGGMMGPPGGG